MSKLRDKGGGTVKKRVIIVLSLILTSVCVISAISLEKNAEATILRYHYGTQTIVLPHENILTEDNGYLLIRTPSTFVFAFDPEEGFLEIFREPVICDINNDSFAVYIQIVGIVWTGGEPNLTVFLNDQYVGMLQNLHRTSGVIGIPEDVAKQLVKPGGNTIRIEAVENRIHLIKIVIEYKYH